MPGTLHKTSTAMTVGDFLDWPGDDSGRKFQLVDGEVRAMSPGSATHGTIHAALGYLISSHLVATSSSCYAAMRPPVAPRLRASLNLRRPALGVTGIPDRQGQYWLLDPIALIEVLSPGNASDTWDNVWSYTTIPSVREIVVVHSTSILAEVLRRGTDGHWPEEPEEIGADGTLRLESIDFACPLRQAYTQTHLA